MVTQITVINLWMGAVHSSIKTLVCQAASYVNVNTWPLTNSDNTRAGHRREQPSAGSDNSARRGDIGSNGPRSDTGNTVHGSNMRRLAQEQNKQ
jgi:hypothetical protein